MPDLRVCQVSTLRRHEHVDPLRVGRLAERMREEACQQNPVVCVESSSGDYVLLDGATRTEALKQLGVEYVIVQLVSASSVVLDTWNHVVRDTTYEELAAAVTSHQALEIGEDHIAPRIWASDGSSHSVAWENLSANQALNSLANSYTGRWVVDRVIGLDFETITWRFPDWAAVVEYPSLTVEDVARAALSGDLLPPGVTRFLVRDRALRLNIGLDLLQGADSVDQRQAELEEIIGERAHHGRIRRYEEPVVILDD